MEKIFTAILVLISFVPCEAQRNITIDIKTCYTNNKQFFIYIKKKEDSIHVRYILLDSISKKLDEDSVYETNRLAWIAINGSAQKDVDSAKKLMHIMDSVWNSYSYFTTDSISFRANSYLEYTRLLQTVCRQTAQELIRPDPDQFWVTADGTCVIFLINDGKRSKKVSTTSPRKETNPVLNDLLTKTFDLFRDGNGTKKLPRDDPRTIGW